MVKKLRGKKTVEPSVKPRKPKLSEINELTMSVFIVKKEKEQELLTKIKQFGARVLSSVRGLGVSRNTVFESLKIGTEECIVCFAMCRDEDLKDFMQFINLEMELSVPGNGKGFTVDIDGYLGAKALFIEN